LPCDVVWGIKGIRKRPEEGPKDFQIRSKGDPKTVKTGPFLYAPLGFQALASAKWLKSPGKNTKLPAPSRSSERIVISCIAEST
jgi:hypothetical protein